MKRFLLITTLACVTLLSNAQSCTPDNTITTPGVYPDQPDTAFAGQAYDFSFQVLALKDTAVVFAGQNLNASIDSVRVDDVIGLPSGFEYTCNPVNCLFTWSAVGCVNVKGNPTQAQAGTYDLEIATTAYARAGLLALPVPDTADGYQLIIKGDGSASIFDLSNAKINIYPNPSSHGKFTLSAHRPISDIRVYDIQGKIADYKQVADIGKQVVDLSRLPKGVYYLRAKVGDEIISKKLIH